MLQILIWAVCVLIVGVGFCGKQLSIIAQMGMLAVKEEDKTKIASGSTIVMVIIAIIIAILALLQGSSLL